MEKTDGLINLLTNVPLEIKSKLAAFSNNDEILAGKVELVALIGMEPEKIKVYVESIGGKFEDLGFGFAIITISATEVQALASNINVQYLELPKVLFTSFIDSNRDICVTGAWDQYGVTGKGVLVGFIDSGIDYLHPTFKDNEGNTRIDYIYDLSGGGQIFDKKQIEEAIKSKEPYKIVSQIDTLGHGTHVASIACGGGPVDKRYYGVAYESSIAMVKMTGEGKINYGKSTQMMRGIKFLIDKSKELNKPLVINMSFSTNDGAHDGTSLLEQYISVVSSFERVNMVIAAGNDGDSAHHFSKIIEKEEKINFNIGAEEKVIFLQFYKNFLDNYSIQIVNPKNNKTTAFILNEGYYQGKISKDLYFIYNTGPKPFSIDGEIVITLTSSVGFLNPGIWSINIIAIGDTGKIVNLWLPTSEKLSKDTKFLEPNSYNTIGIPATANNIISVGSYDFATNNISSFSGRGAIYGYNQKLDLVAPGENIEAAIPGGEYDSLSGTSMATPHVAGACALLMDYGIVKKNDPYMYGQRLRYFLLSGAKRNRTEVVYPSPIWGYGILCVSEAINLIQNGVTLTRNFKSGIEIYIPSDINSLLNNINKDCKIYEKKQYRL